MNPESALREVLSQPAFQSFTHEPQRGHYRPPGKGGNVSPEVLSARGYFNHVTGEYIPLSRLLKRDIAVSTHAPMNHKGGQADKSKKVTPGYIWKQSRPDSRIAKRYFKTRNLHPDDDLINKMEIRVNQYRCQNILVFPMRNTRGDLIQLQRVGLKGDYSKDWKRFTGSATEDRSLLIRRDESRLAVFEGLEDGLTYLLHGPGNDSVLICFGTAGFSRIKSFVDQFEKVGVFLDNDKDNQSLNASKKLPDKVVRLIPTTEPGLDCNAAHQQGRLQEWIRSLRQP